MKQRTVFVKFYGHGRVLIEDSVVAYLDGVEDDPKITITREEFLEAMESLYVKYLGMQVGS